MAIFNVIFHIGNEITRVYCNAICPHVVSKYSSVIRLKPNALCIISGRNSSVDNIISGVHL